MVIVILMFTSLLIQTNCVPVSENDDDNVTPKGRYSFNHPPTVGEYNPIVKNVEHSEDSDIKIRIGKALGGIPSRDELIIHNSTSIETIQRNTDVNKTIDSKPKVYEIDNGPTQKDKAIVRRTKVKKRIIQHSEKISDNVKLNNIVQKQKIFQTTTLKPTVTTLTISNKPKASADVNSNPTKLKEPRQRDPVVPIIESENYVYSHNGNFHYSYVGGDGTQVSEEGKLKVFDNKTAGEAVVGSFSYTDKDGNDFSLTYTADENGYRPVGAHLPTPPPIPPAIARALQYLSTKTTTESTTKI